MSIAFAIAIYFVIWWVLLFAVLPWGVRTSEEVGEDTNTGFADSAPYKPRLIPKVIAGVYAIMVHHVITLDDIPFLPDYEPVQEAH